MEKRKHYDVIVAWANGANIQWRRDRDSAWVDVAGTPIWVPGYEYQIKPDPLKYRLWQRTDGQILVWTNKMATSQSGVTYWDYFQKWITPELEVELDV